MAIVIQAQNKLIAVFWWLECMAQQSNISTAELYERRTKVIRKTHKYWNIIKYTNVANSLSHYVYWSDKTKQQDPVLYIDGPHRYHKDKQIQKDPWFINISKNSAYLYLQMIHNLQMIWTRIQQNYFREANKKNGKRNSWQAVVI